RVVRASRGEYVFVDEWEVDAPAEAVFDALADATTYPQWWRPVYLDVETDGPLAVGQVSTQHFKGRLPYELRTRSRIVRLAVPRGENRGGPNVALHRRHQLDGAGHPELSRLARPRGGFQAGARKGRRSAPRHLVGVGAVRPRRGGRRAERAGGLRRAAERRRP